MSKIALILHGWPQTGINEHVLVSFLKANNYQVLTPDLLDTGKSWTSTRVFKKIMKEVGKNTPDLIVGISMGGLLLPRLAKYFKNAKLIFIASAPSFKPDIKLMKFMNRLLKKDVVENVMSYAYNKLSDRHISNIYRIVNPFSGRSNQRKLYEIDLRKNITAIRKYPFSRHLDILKAISAIDNTNLLTRLNNPTVIFGGRIDSLMPLGEVMKLKKLIKGSRLYITHGSHFNVFTKKNLKQLESFIEG